MKTTYLLTFDSDWCPDWMLEEVLEILESRELAATFFLTNAPAASLLERLDRAGRIQVGIHPNFFPENAVARAEELLKSLLNEVGPCTVCRTHGLFWWHGLGEILRKLGIRDDSSLSAPGHSLTEPLRVSGVNRYPISLGDWSLLDSKGSIEDVLQSINSFGPLRVLNFHPIHIALNTDSIDEWTRIKHVQREDPSRLRDLASQNARRQGFGLRDIFLSVIKQIAQAQTATFECLREAGEGQ